MQAIILCWQQWALGDPNDLQHLNLLICHWLWAAEEWKMCEMKTGLTIEKENTTANAEHSKIAQDANYNQTQGQIKKWVYTECHILNSRLL